MEESYLKYIESFNELDIEDKKEEIKKWYDGVVFGNIIIIQMTMNILIYYLLILFP